MSEALETRLLFAGTPTIATMTPASGATNVALATSITATFNLPNGNLNPLTVISSNCYLYQTAYPNDHEYFIGANIQLTGNGTGFKMTPLYNLMPSTEYTVVITSGLADVNGDTATPVTWNFTTANAFPAVSQNYAFDEVQLPTAQGYEFTDMQIGPDGFMYASTNDGRILRYTINSDDTLSTPQIITSLQTAYGGKRLITGFAFDPSFMANPTKPMLWVSNTFYALSGATNGPNFTSSLTVMSGPNLGTVTDAIVDLPRSIADHVNDQPVFQPGTNNLFFCQAGQNAYGAPDATWGNRAETLLSAAILEVNTSALNLNGPALNVLTPDVGGTYNPYATGAPLTIYATGIRNAFAIFFDDQGQMWAPTNGSSPGGNTPAGGGAPALTDVQQTETDTLVKVVKGAYYGHPDPARNQFVLGQGNPTTGGIPSLAFTAYPSGTNPDPNWQEPNFLFGLHSSPDGMIEYHGNAFGGALNGKFLVGEYSANNDLVVLSRDSNDNIIGGLVSKATGPQPDHLVSGFTNLEDPLAICEDPRTGNVFIDEYGASKLSLWVPSSIPQEISVSATSVSFNAVATGYTGAGPSRVANITIANLGANPLLFPTGGISIVDDPAASPAAANFKILNPSVIPNGLANATSITLQIQYTANAVALQSALLQIKSNDPNTPTLSINLHGIGTAGLYGSLEPSLVQVLRAFNIPTIVGAGPNDVNINVTPYPENPDPTSQEVAMPILEAATSGPVTITPLASFSASASTVSEIGYYTPGSPSSTMKLFSIAQADAQTVSPTAVGSTSFTPGTTPFGLYAYFPGIVTSDSSPDYHYSQDSLNTLDPANPRKIRFFPMENGNGTIVPNTFVFAVEDYNGTMYNSFDNFVGIISNVTAMPNTPTNFAVSTASGNSASLTWTASFGATSYNVQREDPGSSTFASIATGLTSATFSDTSIVAGAMYEYEVQAENGVGDSAFSAPVSVTFVPSTPTNLQSTSESVSGVALTWNASSGATSYTLEREAPGSNSFASIAAGLTSPMYTDTQVAAGQTYQYEVLAINAGGSSTLTAPLAVAVPVPLQTLAITVGKGANKAVIFTNSAGTVTTIKLAGRGDATVNLAATTISQSSTAAGVIVNGSNISLTGITLTGTNISGSALSILTKGGSNTVLIGSISTDGPIASIAAGTSSLTGALTAAGPIGKLTLGSAVTATISAPTIGALVFNGNAEVKLNAATVRSVRVAGSLHDSTIDLSASGQDLASLSADLIVNTALDSAGNIGAISANTLSNSQIYAGTNANGLATFPPESTGFPVTATISSVTLHKQKGMINDVNSSIAAYRINTLSLGTIQLSNGGVSFGVEASLIGALSAVDSSNATAFTLSHLTKNSDVAADLAKKKISPQDFTIKLI